MSHTTYHSNASCMICLICLIKTTMLKLTLLILWNILKGSYHLGDSLGLLGALILISCVELFHFKQNPISFFISSLFLVVAFSCLAWEVSLTFLIGGKVVSRSHMKFELVSLKDFSLVCIIESGQGKGLPYMIWERAFLIEECVVSLEASSTSGKYLFFFELASFAYA